jgi:hypothetical protein
LKTVRISGRQLHINRVGEQVESAAPARKAPGRDDAVQAERPARGATERATPARKER